MLDGLRVIFGTSEEREWMQHGRCRGTSVHVFFPDEEQRDWARRVAEAKLVCYGCPVILECLEWALAHNEKEGVWGGTSERERRRIKRARARKALKR